MRLLWPRRRRGYLDPALRALCRTTGSGLPKEMAKDIAIQVGIMGGVVGLAAGAGALAAGPPGAAVGAEIAHFRLQFGLRQPCSRQRAQAVQGPYRQARPRDQQRHSRGMERNARWKRTGGPDSCPRFCRADHGDHSCDDRRDRKEGFRSNHEGLRPGNQGTRCGCGPFGRRKPVRASGREDEGVGPRRGGNSREEELHTSGQEGDGAGRCESHKAPSTGARSRQRASVFCR